jgi:hypothetical protein
LSDEDLTNEGFLEEYLLFEVKQKKLIYEAPLTENLSPEVTFAENARLKYFYWEIYHMKLH